jgi:hypothetical protein
LLAKYDSLNKIQISGYLVDLFRLLDSPRKDNQLGLMGYLNPIVFHNQAQQFSGKMARHPTYGEHAPGITSH